MTDFNFKYYGEYDISNIEFLISTNTLDWETYTYRQTHRKGQSHTKTIPLIWEENFNGIKKWDSYSIFESEINKIEVTLKNILGEGIIMTALLINLPKHREIGKHVDSGSEHFFKTNRIHIPIETNDKCLFTVSDETIHMEKGTMWEINNSTKIHSVENGGETDRIHLLIDYQQSNSNLI